MPRRSRFRAAARMTAVSIAAFAVTAAMTVASVAAPFGYYTRYRRSYLSWPWNLIYIIVLVIVCAGAVIFRMTPRGRELLSRNRMGSNPFDSETDVYPRTSASTPLAKPKGINDCPQCGLATTPDMAQCPKCGWNLHHFGGGGAGRDGCMDPTLIAGLAAVSMAPLAAAAAREQAPGATPSPAAPEDTSRVPAMPAEDETGGPAGSPGAGGNAAGEEVADVPAASPEAGFPVVGVVQHDIVIDGVVAFREGERVAVEGESPDAARPEQKYVAESRVLKKKFLLSDIDVFL